ncbi:phosphopantetheine-binding protein [Streptomonospora salina]|uniref:Aryl carrier-like protein n=1 Tax=Streptomonospora salina TaxID=104205 RepID=A0A841E6N4_9ACTN|nr:phosphopantetheine-binding protein [Streptomonospora salina]MBB5996969.1 aryl carrier-like protein [Streptomonospora salina]
MQLLLGAGGGADGLRRRPFGLRAPQGSLEELLAGIAADVLGATRVVRDDSFFSLGCDSVRAVQLAEALSEHRHRAARRTAVPPCG